MNIKLSATQHYRQIRLKCTQQRKKYIYVHAHMKTHPQTRTQYTLNFKAHIRTRTLLLLF